MERPNRSTWGVPATADAIRSVAFRWHCIALHELAGTPHVLKLRWVMWNGEWLRIGEWRLPAFGRTNFRQPPEGALRAARSFQPTCIGAFGTTSAQGACGAL